MLSCFSRASPVPICSSGHRGGRGPAPSAPRGNFNVPKSLVGIPTQEVRTRIDLLYKKTKTLGIYISGVSRECSACFLPLLFSFPILIFSLFLPVLIPIELYCLYGPSFHSRPSRLSSHGPQCRRSCLSHWRGQLFSPP
jgi:hypothetical protein